MLRILLWQFFWTESTGFAAAIKTIKIFNEENVAKFLVETGDYIGSRLLEIAKRENLKIKINEFKPLISFKFLDFENQDLINTFFTQEMLKRGFLATNSIYLSFAHKKNLINLYLKNFQEVLHTIAKNKNDIKGKLLGKIRSADFKRLT